MHTMRMLGILGIVSAALLTLLSGTSQAQTKTSESRVDSCTFCGNLFEMLQKQPLPYNQNFSNLTIGDKPTVSASLLQVRERLSGNYQAEQDEVVYLIKGRGVMTVAGEARAVQPGDVILMGQGQAYSLENRSAEPLAALVVVIRPNRESE